MNPLTTHLVVADPTRTEKTICLAVTPSLKAYGISGRARLFEVIRAVREINDRRFSEAVRQRRLPKDERGRYRFPSESFDAGALAADPSLKLGFLIAPPRMKLYEEISTKIFSIYMKYISAEDIHVYSIDECFMDVTAYLNTYQMTAHELAVTMIRDVLYETGITATAGIGTNLFLAKVAMDIVAKHVPADKDGVRIAELDERTFREKLWCHMPLTDFWMIGRGTARRVEALGCSTMGDIARLSTVNEDALYKALGIKAELVIDHAWGWEPTEIAAVKAYRPSSNSLSSGQVLKEPYDMEKARLIVREMTELLALDLVRKCLVTQKITLTLCYDRTSLEKMDTSGGEEVYRVAKTGLEYTGQVVGDGYGRPVPHHAHGTGNLEHWTSSGRKITAEMMRIFDRIADPDLYVRRVTICACDLIRERQREQEQKEKALQKATLRLQERFGKNAVLKGLNLVEGGTTIERNGQIGGHSAGGAT